MPARTTRTQTRAAPVSAAASGVRRRPVRDTTSFPRGSDGLGVVVLVLIAVIARVVVLVAGEVDLVEDDPDLLGMRLDDRLQRPFREPAPRHLRADHEHDA